MRNKIEANTLAFNNLFEAFSSLSQALIEPGKRYIKTSEEEQKWLIECKLTEKIQITPGLSATLIEYNDCSYIALIGNKLETSNIDNDILLENPLNAGLLTVLLAEKIVSLNRNILPLAFYDLIPFQHKEAEYKGHDFEDLIIFLDNINIFEIPQNSVLSATSIFRIITYIIAQDKSYLILNFSNSTINLFSDIALMGSDKISFESILNSLLSANFKHSFLELYRLIERLFPINYLKELHIAVNTPLSFLQFSASIENVTSWRPLEQDAIEKIFTKTKESTLTLFNSVIINLLSHRNTATHTFFYKLRNSIVHFRANHEEALLSDEQWSLITQATLELIDQHYSQNQSLL